MTKNINEKLRNTIKTAETLKMITRPSERLRRIFAKHAMTQELTDQAPQRLSCHEKCIFW